MKKYVVILFSVLVGLSFSMLPVAGAQTLTAKFGHVAPSFHGQTKGADAFAAYVKEKTNGAIDIKTFPMSQLGGEVSLAEQVQAGTLEIASAILSAAALSFLGLGAQPPTPEWGSMLGSERNQVFTAPHLVFFPGAAITLTVLGFNLLGDGLRDALDPRLGRGTKIEVV